MYKDLNIDFDNLHPITGDLTVLNDYDAIKTSIKNLILTNKKEIPFERSKGSLIKNILFEPNTPYIKHDAKQYIEDVLYIYEPRITLVDVIIDNKQYGISITIVYNINKMDQQDSVIITLDTAS